MSSSSLEGGEIRPPAMSDVARVAGVSHQTVSRVLNEPEKVKPATRERVQRAISDLGYRRNVAARALVTRRSGAIGVVIPATSLYGPTSTLLGLEGAARSAGYWLSFASLPSADAASMRDALSHFIDQGVDALVVIAPTEGVLDAVRETPAALPVVTITSAEQAGSVGGAVSVDQRLGARLATEHLIGLGHRRIGHIAGRSNWFDAQQRMAGWRDALTEAGLAEGPTVPGDWTAESGRRGAAELVRAELERPTAIFAGNDQMALGALRALGEAGLAVPGDVSVIGFDDTPGSGHYQPPLSTVHQDFDELGRRALAAVMARLDPAGREPAPATVEPVLIVRASTGSAPTGTRP